MTTLINVPDLGIFVTPEMLSNILRGAHADVELALSARPYFDETDPSALSVITLLSSTILTSANFDKAKTLPLLNNTSPTIQFDKLGDDGEVTDTQEIDVLFEVPESTDNRDWLDKLDPKGSADDKATLLALHKAADLGRTITTAKAIVAALKTLDRSEFDEALKEAEVTDPTAVAETASEADGQEADGDEDTLITIELQPQTTQWSFREPAVMSSYFHVLGNCGLLSEKTFGKITEAIGRYEETKSRLLNYQTSAATNPLSPEATETDATLATARQAEQDSLAEVAALRNDLAKFREKIEKRFEEMGEVRLTFNSSDMLTLLDEDKTGAAQVFLSLLTSTGSANATHPGEEPNPVPFSAEVAGEPGQEALNFKVDLAVLDGLSRQVSSDVASILSSAFQTA